MPLVRIAHPTGKSAAYRAALSEGVHRSLVEAFGVPEDDRFHVLSAHEPGTDIVRPASYLGVAYSNELVILQITCNAGRTVEQKKALYAAIANRFATDPGLRREDVVINLVEVTKENWSFGLGLAQYAT